MAIHIGVQELSSSRAHGCLSTAHNFWCCRTTSRIDEPRCFVICGARFSCSCMHTTRPKPPGNQVTYRAWCEQGKGSRGLGSLPSRARWYLHLAKALENPMKFTLSWCPLVSIPIQSSLWGNCRQVEAEFWCEQIALFAIHYSIFNVRYWLLSNGFWLIAIRRTICWAVHNMSRCLRVRSLGFPSTVFSDVALATFRNIFRVIAEPLTSRPMTMQIFNLAETKTIWIWLRLNYSSHFENADF